MALRNFWLTASIDGRKTLLEGGPVSKDGGMTIRVLQRDDGSKVETVVVRCYERDGVLTTAVEHNGETVSRYQTRR